MMNNPLMHAPLSKRGEEKVLALRDARRSAKKAARSGHPGRRAEGVKALGMIPGEIWRVYATDGSLIR